MAGLLNVQAYQNAALSVPAIPFPMANYAYAILSTGIVRQSPGGVIPVPVRWGRSRGAIMMHAALDPNIG